MPSLNCYSSALKSGWVIFSTRRNLSLVHRPLIHLCKILVALRSRCNLSIILIFIIEMRCGLCNFSTRIGILLPGHINFSFLLLELLNIRNAFVPGFVFWSPYYIRTNMYSNSSPDHHSSIVHAADF